MAKITINVGSTPNDGTGDSIRGAFSNVNNNFTEVYNNIGNIAITLTQSYDKANAANLFTFNTGVGANAWANLVAGYANTWANTVAQIANAYTVTVGAESNNWANIVGTASNNYTNTLATAGNNYSIQIGATSNAWTNTVVVAANNWANSIALAGNNYSDATFATRSNVALVFNTTNSAFNLANTSVQNTSTTLNGTLTVNSSLLVKETLTVSGSIFDTLGLLRPPVVYTGDANNNVQYADLIVIANNASRIYVNVDNDGRFISNTQNGAMINIIQSGAGATIIRANDASVTLLSSNNWFNVATQYSEVKITRIASNTWVVTGNLKA